MRRIRGVDVSTFQGVITDAIAEALVREGCVFAYCRGAVGNEAKPDDRFKANVEVFLRHGIAVGSYLFPYPLPKLDPKAQAESHMRLVEGLGSNVGELAPMIDAEWPPREEWKVIDGVKTLTYPWQKWGCSKEQIRGFLEVYGARLDELSGCNCPLYSYRYWWECIAGWLSEPLCARPFVLADYGMKGRVPNDDELVNVVPPKGISKITILQHDGDGGLRLPTPSGVGSGNDVDWNVMPDPNDLFKLLGQRGDPLPMPADDGAVLVDPAVKQDTMGLIVDDMIAEYRRTRIDVDT